MNQDHGHRDTPGRRLGEEAMRRLRSRAVCSIEPGLTDAEFARVEQQFGFRFADDHRAFLAAGLPVSAGPAQPGLFRSRPERWPDWRDGEPATLRGFLEWPAEGVLFDVENNGFWHDSWGPRPTGTGAAVQTARQRLTEVPRMVPVYGHRYLPAGRGTFGHPVLSIRQTDIVYYGLDLPDYIDREFGAVEPKGDVERKGGVELEEGTEAWNPRATVDFWRDLL